MAECEGCGEEHGEACNGCRFWERINIRLTGSCRRHAPWPLSLPEPAGLGGDRVTVWPETMCHEWCGEFVPRRANP